MLRLVGGADELTESPHGSLVHHKRERGQLDGETPAAALVKGHQQERDPGLSLQFPQGAALTWSSCPSRTRVSHEETLNPGQDTLHSTASLALPDCCERHSKGQKKKKKGWGSFQREGDRDELSGGVSPGWIPACLAAVTPLIRGRALGVQLVSCPGSLLACVPSQAPLLSAELVC